ncbi:MAG: Rne/Rng family ribonuclease [Amaricoccus sp.]|uniref:Rne/Rng family ribonuclease n=1 Tax=Amaricoccus sp. TaxID=1872485 RepID=UPI0039E63D55
MTKKMLIDATHAEETRVVVVDGNKVEDFDFESLNKRQLAGNIYLAKVTRVEPSLQAAFVDYGGNRHGFLAFSEIHPDYYQIPKADREALLREEAEFARQADEEVTREKAKPRGRSRSRKRPAPAGATVEDAVIASEEVVTQVDGAAEFADMPPPSAAAGDIDIQVPDEPERPSDELAPPPVMDAMAEAAAIDPAAADPHLETDTATAAPADALVEEDEEDLGAASHDHDHDGHDHGGHDHADAPEGYESVGGDDVQEERTAPRRSKLRRYKIQEVIKVRQILLVQVVKEERGNKGAALTTYLSLAGRYCVLMPNTARGGGISRKITNAADRKKLKEISSSITVPEGAGLIIRTAGASRTKTEIKRDYEYLLRQWEQIRDLTLKSIAPAPIYEEGSLIKRAIRDLYSREMDEILVDGERGYREAKDYMKMLMPSHAKNVRHYGDPLPLFSRFQVESYLSAMFNPVVQLKSGGYIVIDVTEALVAIDVNSGRATREASIEDTALKTNLEAAEEAARQMRLRDLAGLIVIDFIDMEDRRNNAAVEKRLKEKLKSDRARIQVGRISAFGLLEMSRQRLRPGMIEATTKGCPHCHGTGRVRSDDSMALAMLREIEEEGVKQRSKEVLIVAPVEIANYLLNQKREHIAMIEGRFGLSVRVEGDPSLISPDYRVERFKTASRIVPAASALLPVVAYPDEVEEEEEIAEAVATPEAAEAPGGEKSNGKRKRRRRRRGGKGNGENGHEAQDAAGDDEAEGDDADGAVAEDTPEVGDAPESAAEVVPVSVEPEAEAAPRRRSRSRSRSRTADEPAAEAAPVAAAETAPVAAVAPAVAPASPFDEVIELGDEAVSQIVDVPEANAPQRKPRERVRKPATTVLADVPTGAVAAVAPAFAPTQASDVAEAEREPETEASDAIAEQAAVTPEAAPEFAPEPTPESAASPEPEMASASEGSVEAAMETVAETAVEDDKPQEPKRRGWWSRAISGS